MVKSIGDRIRERRRELHMSQEALCAKSGVCRATLSAIENGKDNDILVGTITALALALDTTVEFFFN